MALGRGRLRWCLGALAVVGMLALAAIGGDGRPSILCGDAVRKGRGAMLAECEPEAPALPPHECDGRDCPGVSFPLPQYATSGAEYNENNRGWTSSGVLDEDGGYREGMFGRSAATMEMGGARKVDPKGKIIDGEVMEKKDEVPYKDLAKATNCGCAVCPCRGDDDIDTVSNGGWYWPIETRALHQVKGKGKVKTAKHEEKKHSYTVHVEPVRQKIIVTKPTKIVYKDRILYKTRYVPVPEKTIIEKSVYVPVYDDPFWNPQADGRLAGEGIGAPQLNPRGALTYASGAWYEHGLPRHNMLDALGGTLDTDQNVDQPADLGVWWADSLPTSKMASSLSDNDSF